MLIGYIMNQKENINAPKVDAIIPKGVTDKPSICGALLSTKMEEEIWRPIKGFEDYFISNYGNLYSIKGKNKSIRSKSSRILNGYKSTSLFLNGKGFAKRINRLVAIAFIPNPENKPEVNHIDCNKINNYYKNLEWCTHIEHELHSVLNKLHPSGENHPLHRLTNLQVNKIRKLYAEGNLSHRDLAKKFNVRHTTIGEITRNETYNILI